MFGTISGAHFNLVITLSEAWQKSMPFAEVAPYIAAQIVGGFAARPEIVWGRNAE